MLKLAVDTQIIFKADETRAIGTPGCMDCDLASDPACSSRKRLGLYCRAALLQKVHREVPNSALHRADVVESYRIYVLM